MSDAAAQREAGDPGVGDVAAGHGEPERLGGAVDLGPDRAALHGGALGGRVDVHLVQPAQVDHHGAIGDRVTGQAVPAALDGDPQPVLAREGDRGLDVREARALEDEGGAAVDVAVPDLARLIVARVLGRDDAALERRAQVAHHGGRQLCAHGDTPFPTVCRASGRWWCAWPGRRCALGRAAGPEPSEGHAPASTTNERVTRK